MKRALFSPNHARGQKLPVKRLFDKLFPQMAEFIRQEKAGEKTQDDDRPHGKFAIRAQYQESKFIIYTCVNESVRNNPIVGSPQSTIPS